MREKFVLGTRGSELALTQARIVEQALRAKWSGLEIEISVIKTSGDERSTPAPVADARAGLKGLFTGEIERALLAREIDLAVHSAKDLPSELTAGTGIAATLPRASTDDVLVSLGKYTLDELPHAGIVATGSVRRKHQLHWKRPDLEVVDLRGNVPTRLRKLATDRWHGIVLAGAGLERLGITANGPGAQFQGIPIFLERLPRHIFLPAGGQGIIAIQVREQDDRLKMLLEAINDLDSRLCLRAEREFLRLLQADCNQPIGVLATVNGSLMQIRAQIFHLESTTPHQAEVEGHFEDAEKLAAALFKDIHDDKISS